MLLKVDCEHLGIEPRTFHGGANTLATMLSYHHIQTIQVFNPGFVSSNASYYMMNSKHLIILQPVTCLAEESECKNILHPPHMIM